jgi:predicted metal-dependent hydrolase
MKKGIKLRPNWDQQLPKYWFDNSPFKTALFDSFQIAFPDGEVYFIESINKFKEEIDDVDLMEDIEEFIRQEVWHTKVHKDYNNHLEKLGRIDKSILTMASDKKVNSALGNLAATVCMEHLTAIASDWLYSHPELLDQMHPHFRDIWQWHMDEESTHRSVSYDVWKIITNRIIEKHPNSKKTFDKVLQRGMNKVCLINSLNFFKHTVFILKKEGNLYKWRTLKDFASFIFNPKNGVLVHCTKPLLQFYKKDFHPWKYALQPK